MEKTQELNKQISVSSSGTISFAGSTQPERAAANAHHVLPNLNFGLSVKSHQCSIHPTIVPNVLDHYLRRPKDQNVVMGTLLGSKDGSQINISTSFAVPLTVNSESDITLDKDFLTKMLKFHRKVNPKEGLVGLYYTTNVISKSVNTLFAYYLDLLKDKKNKPVINQPLLMLVDPTMQDHRMSIKVMSIVNSNPVVCFAECPFTFQCADFERTGLDVLFFGQEHYDTMAILQNRKDISQGEVSTLMRDQKLFSNKELMLRNFKEVIDNLSDCECYIQDVLDGKKQGNSDLGRLLDDTMGQFSTDDMAHLEQLVAGNFEDALMINSLARLQQGQLRITEKLNNIFAESFNTSNNNNTTNTSSNANNPSQQVRSRKDHGK